MIQFDRSFSACKMYCHLTPTLFPVICFIFHLYIKKCLKVFISVCCRARNYCEYMWIYSVHNPPHAKHEFFNTVCSERSRTWYGLCMSNFFCAYVVLLLWANRSIAPLCLCGVLHCTYTEIFFQNVRLYSLYLAWVSNWVHYRNERTLLFGAELMGMNFRAVQEGIIEWLGKLLDMELFKLWI
jgi:type IV secretory pathway VirB3-like protein